MQLKDYGKRVEIRLGNKHRKRQRCKRKAEKAMTIAEYKRMDKLLTLLSKGGARRLVLGAYLHSIIS